MSSKTVAALFVQEKGPYSRLPQINLWGPIRDARLYPGPHPVVAHPPCERWGGYAAGGPSNHGKFKPGDDGGCFEAALKAVQRWGGILEHPAKSKAFSHFGLGTPPSTGWSEAEDGKGWICQVEQYGYGHISRKKTWLYASRVILPELRWGDQVGEEPKGPWDESSVKTFQKPPKDAPPEWREERRRWIK